MAPRRGGGGSSSGSSISSTCPGAFADTVDQVTFAANVVFLVVFFGIAISLCSVRKKSAGGKKLLGAPYSIAILFFIIGYILAVIVDVLQQCDKISYYDYYKWNVAMFVFFYLGYWLLLFTVIYTLNSMLQDQRGHASKIIKIALLAVVAFMFVLTATLIGLQSYVNSQQISSVFDDSYKLLLDTSRFRLAYYIFYMLTVLASGGLALMTILSLRKARHPAGDLIGWLVALTIAMILWPIILIAWEATSLSEELWEWETSVALTYIINAAQALSFVFVLCIAKHIAWNAPPAVGHGVAQDVHVAPKEYAHNAPPAGNVNAGYYYQQQPAYQQQAAYVGAGNPMTHPVR